MKKLLIAASIFASFSSMANNNASTLSFTVDGSQNKVCSLESVYGDAKLSFYGQGTDAENIAHILVRTSNVNRIRASAESSWSELSAWEGVTPKLTVRFDYYNSIEYNTEDFMDTYYFERELNTNQAIDLRSTLSFRAITERPTSNASGKLDVIVQVECE